MKTILLPYLSALLSMLLIDAVWLTLMVKRFYTPRIGHLMSSSVSYAPAVAFYLIYVAGLTFLVLYPALREQWSLREVFARGAVIGLLAYATYDLTNQATLKNWPISITLMDMAWGAFITAAVASIAVAVSR